MSTTTPTPRSGGYRRTSTDSGGGDGNGDGGVGYEFECAHCGCERDPHDSVAGSYCSTVCYYRERGERVLNQLRTDHAVCSTCYGKVKDIEPIPDLYYEDADGYQHATELTVHVQDVSFGPGESNHKIQFTRWGCDCGCVNPNDTHAEIQRSMLPTVISNCFHALEYLHRRGAIPFSPTRTEYFDALREGPRGPYDGAYAIGRAIYPPPGETDGEE